MVRNRSLADIFTGEEKKKKPLWKKVVLISGIVVFSIFLLIFLLVWVVFPIVFMTTVGLQRFFMFVNVDDPKNPDFDHPNRYNISDVLNFYMSVPDLDNKTVLTIGAWLILPHNKTDIETILQNTENPHNQTVVEILATTSMPVLIYLHGVACNRIKQKKTYEVARNFFLVISVDHRGYGDSGTDSELSEKGVVSDTSHVYQWIRFHTENEIFFWGHSLGAAIATHSLRNLKEYYDIIPMGLILESPFSTMRDEVYTTKITKLFRWLAYFNSTFLEPLERNGFLFRSTTNILYVDCPIIIMHAEDDDVVPYTLGKKLYETAYANRKIDQGNISYYQFPAVGYNHANIVDNPDIPNILESFIEDCRTENKTQG